MDKTEFMEFFRDDDALNTLSNVERKEIFLSILTGSSDITEELILTLLEDYDCDFDVQFSSPPELRNSKLT